MLAPKLTATALILCSVHITPAEPDDMLQSLTNTNFPWKTVTLSDFFACFFWEGYFSFHLHLWTVRTALLVSSGPKYHGRARREKETFYRC